jgi:hypothetical protein
VGGVAGAVAATVAATSLLALLINRGRIRA